MVGRDRWFSASDLGPRAAEVLAIQLKHVVDGVMKSQAGMNSAVRTIWIIDRGEEAPRFVAAYPGEK